MEALLEQKKIQRITLRDPRPILRGYLNAREPKVARILFDTWNAQRSQVKYQEIAHAIETGQMPEVWFRQWQKDYNKFVSETLVHKENGEWPKAFESSMRRVSEDISRATLRPFEGNPLGDNLLRWIDSRGASLVTGDLSLVETQNRAVRVMLRHYIIEEPISAQELGRIIRASVGLTDRQAGAVQRLRDTLVKEGELSTGAVEGQVAKYAGQLHRQRAVMIARNEIATAYNFAQNETIKQAQEANYFGNVNLAKIWMTAEDELVCFPAGTEIETPFGIVSIERLDVGAIVKTPHGNRKIKATAKRDYSGTFTAIKAGDNFVISTSNHPFNSGGKWVSASSLVAGQFLNFIGNERIKIDAVINFGIFDSKRMPPILFEKGITPFVFGDIRMPIVAINLDNESFGRYGEIGRPASNLELLNEGYAEPRKGLSDCDFMPCFSPESSATSKRAKTPIEIAGEFSELCSAGFTDYKNGGTPACFGAIIPTESFFAQGKPFTTPLTVGISGIGQPTFFATNGIAVLDTCINDKFFATGGTELGDGLGLFTSKIANTRTKLSFGAKPQFETEFFATKDTDSFWNSNRSLMITVSGAKRTLPLNPLGAVEFLSTIFAKIEKRHIDNLLSIFNQIIQKKSITVFNFEVDTERENERAYFANKFLVHNCPICEPLNDTEIEMEGDFEFSTPRARSGGREVLGHGQHPPAHVACRCSIGYRTVEL